MGLAGAASEGYISVESYATYDEDTPEVKLELEVAQKYGRGTKKDIGNYKLGWLSAMITWEALKRAVDKKGYPITGIDVKESLDNMRDFDTNGFSGKISYTPDDHRGAHYIHMVQVRGGKVVPLTDWFEAPWIRPE